MTREDVKAIVFEEIEKVIDHSDDLDPTDLFEEASFTDDLGFDSLDEIELVMHLEKRFNIGVPDDNIEELSGATIKDWIDYLYTFPEICGR